MSKPEKVFKAGAVRASIFRNTYERNGKPMSIAKVVLEVRYKDKNGEWKSSNSFSLNRCPRHRRRCSKPTSICWARARCMRELSMSIRQSEKLEP